MTDKPIELQWTSLDIRMSNAINALISELYPDAKTKEKNSTHKYLSVLIPWLIRQYRKDPTLESSYGRNKNFNTRSYAGDIDIYNPKKLRFEKVAKVIDALAEAEYVLNTVGNNHRAGETSKLSRVRATEKLLSFIEGYGADEADIEMIPVNEGMILREVRQFSTGKLKKTIHNYSGIEQDETVIHSKTILARYNEFIRSSNIHINKDDIPEDLNEAYDEVEFDRKLSSRIFNHNFKLGGRYYSAWWSQCKKELRPFIKINNEATVELDYRANHLYLLYGLNNRDMPEELKNDPYNLSDEYDRKLFKAIITRIINGAVGQYGWGSIRQEKDLELREFLRTNIPTYQQYQDIEALIFERHPILGNIEMDYPALELQYIDSQIAEYVLDRMTELGLPTLCVHDSFICSIEQENNLRRYMQEAYNNLKIPKGLPPITRKTTA